MTENTPPPLTAIRSPSPSSPSRPRAGSFVCWRARRYPPHRELAPLTLAPILAKLESPAISTLRGRRGGEESVAILEATKAKETFGDTMNRVAFGKERIILTRRGKPLAAIVPLEDLELLDAVE